MPGESYAEGPLSYYLDGAIRNGISPLESQAWTGVQMLGLGCLTPEGFQPRQLKNAPAGVSARHPAVLDDGDLLISRANTRDLVGLAGVYRDIGTPCIYPDLMMRLRLSRECISEFMELLLRSTGVRRRIMAMAQGTSESMVKISAEMVRGLLVPLISLDEQQRIVAGMSAISARINGESQALRKEKAIWDGLVNRQLEDHVTAFATSRLSDVCLGAGSYGSNAAAVPRDDRMPRYVRITDIDDQGELSTDTSSAVSLPWETAQPHLLKDGDLLIARTGYTTGKSYLYRSSSGLCAYAGYLVRYRFDPAAMMPEYAFIWTRANIFKKWVSRNVREVGQRNISAREYDGHRIAVPPLSVQRELVDAWEAARSAILLRQKEISRLRTLKQAIADDLLTVVQAGS